MFASGKWRTWGPSSFDCIISSIFASASSNSGSNIIRFSCDCKSSEVLTLFVAVTVFSNDLTLMSDWYYFLVGHPQFQSRKSRCFLTLVRIRSIRHWH